MKEVILDLIVFSAYVLASAGFVAAVVLYMSFFVDAILKGKYRHVAAILAIILILLVLVVIRLT